MGIGGNFWDMLKPYARTEGFDFLRNKKVAVDLSYWIVQHETAIKIHTRNPHLRLTFFRTINLFSKFGAFPVFVVDGSPSPLKSQARIIRFFQGSGIDLSSLSVADGTSVERNRAFLKCVQECVELLELFGMPVLKANGEAEGLCAQLNREGHVDACITSDSDAFLFGAKCIIKNLKPNTREPFECYYMSDIEAGLGLKREHLIAIALLVGNDHDLIGVQGIGLDTALRLVKSFSEDEILDRLREIGRGDGLHLHENMNCVDFEKSTKTRFSHCSKCGHPGSKRAHLKTFCEHCGSSTSEGCVKKPLGFRCACSSCDMDNKEKERKKDKAWQIKVCNKIVTGQNFPNDAIIEMYLSNNHGNFKDDDISWKTPNTEMLVDYVAYQLNWEPSYIRQKLFPALSTIFLRKIASNQETHLLYGQYEFDFIQRTKIRFGHQFYVVNWKKASSTIDNGVDSMPLEVEEDQEEMVQIFDEHDVANVHVDNGCLMTDENMELVMAAYPEKVQQYMQQKELKSRTKRSLKSVSTPETLVLPTSRSVQLNITEFYRSSKLPEHEKGNGSSLGKRDMSRPLSKSVRRRLLFG